ncbi:MAG: response regulator transcription factor [Aridibacter famidurans]|nr:response regulator transcription factor [Aridibacter famidurans]
MSDAAKIRVMTVDDHPLIQEGITVLVNNQPDMEVVGSAASVREAPEVFVACSPDIVLMDMKLGDGSGVDGMEDLLAVDPDARIVILTMFEGDVGIRRALKAGAKGYVLKSMPPKELLQVIRDVFAGRKHIPPEIASQLAEYFSDDVPTPREIVVLKLVAEGLRNREIAERLSISEDTVKAHMKHIMDKLGASDRTQAVSIGVRRGIIEL